MDEEMLRPVSYSPWIPQCFDNSLFYIITTTVLRPSFRDHSGEAVPEENFWTLRCRGRLTEADRLTIRLGATPSGLTSAHLHNAVRSKTRIMEVQLKKVEVKQELSQIRSKIKNY